MKTLNFSNKSWHYRLARVGDEYHRRDLSNICAYTRAVLAGVFCILIALIVIGIASLFVGDFLAWIAAQVFHWQLIAPAVTAIIILCLIALLSIIFLICLAEDNLRNNRDKICDSFIGASYRSVKERWCARVEIIEKDEQ
jgi:uncharacterized protein YqhQ